MDPDLSELRESLAQFDDPADREELAQACGDVSLQLAEGERNLGDLLGDADADRFESADDASTGV